MRSAKMVRGPSQSMQHQQAVIGSIHSVAMNSDAVILVRLFAGQQKITCIRVLSRSGPFDEIHVEHTLAFGLHFPTMLKSVSVVFVDQFECGLTDVDLPDLS